MGVVIVVAVVLLAAAVALLLARRAASRGADTGSVSTEPDRSGPSVVGFHVSEGSAEVQFEVPLAAGPVDAVLADLLIREAVEVVREKRQTLPLEAVERVIAFGSRDGEWIEIGRVELDTPGTLPPPMVPELLPQASRPGFDAFDRFSDLPQSPPGLADGAEAETLRSLGPEVRLSAAVEAGIRAQGLDPDSIDACVLVLGVMRLSGYTITQSSADTLDAMRFGQRVFIRTVCHLSTDHPELTERQVDRFVVDFLSSGADRGLLITEKFSPFEIYDRERREPRMRFITRERLQAFVDALTVG
ncbi:MAG: hypothetical protein V3W36_04280 [Acidimicrobiia bacterium]